MKNKDDSLIDLNMKNIIIACENDITIMAKTGKCTIYSKSDMTLQTDSNFTLSHKGTGMCNSNGGTMTLQTSHFSVNKG
jgi:hypothetical protein